MLHAIIAVGVMLVFMRITYTFGKEDGYNEGYHKGYEYARKYWRN